jgi:hypothetical protein
MTLEVNPDGSAWLCGREAIKALQHLIKGVGIIKVGVINPFIFFSTIN